jgi:hypothetical protein
MPIREVEAFLNLCAGRLHCSAKRVDEAADEFRRAADGIETLCVDFPRNRQYWINARYFHRTASTLLQQSNRVEDSHLILDQMSNWLLRSATLVPSDPELQKELRLTKSEAVALLRSTGQEDKAKKLESASLATE